ncbi:DUF3574 domain-containing protein [Burkholderia cepacia]|uniref:DUF3574 domain-containing protein n=2 Tax=Burkholderia cepacia TaxID=292 RepID=A0A8I1B0X5_BURCE|nr:DUF3574 domain-containing protein [Burkholderia cepacia]MBA9896232.1 DUF3574 domain-containing protein [Burkholderia cepacia]MBA9943081.1 DUF3574 domain-containing protein [Burkholderia cepacia]MBA9975275.1 DUF3574 domain-containing protein [Burkholderia cepacia]MBA9993416.1 DUF3574 domain-containing protein [Burkholderia cepacia]MBA9999519.1 DUF3574 domain-containing protein [Burkholderia cepacia]
MRPSAACPKTWWHRAAPMIGGVAIALLAGCAAPPPPAAGTAPPPPAAGTAPACTQPGESRMLQADLLFGRDIAGHGSVTDAERAAFLADTVTPRFPDGLTYWDTHGQWRDRTTGGITREDSFVIRIIADDTPDTRVRLAAIRKAYMERFHQESVGMTVVPACASF